LENFYNFPNEFSLNFNKFDKDLKINFVKQSSKSVNPVSSGSPNIYVVQDKSSGPTIHKPQQSRVKFYLSLCFNRIKMSYFISFKMNFMLIKMAKAMLH